MNWVLELIQTWTRPQQGQISAIVVHERFLQFEVCFKGIRMSNKKDLVVVVVWSSICTICCEVWPFINYAIWNAFLVRTRGIFSGMCYEIDLNFLSFFHLCIMFEHWETKNWSRSALIRCVTMFYRVKSLNQIIGLTPQVCLNLSLSVCLSLGEVWTLPTGWSPSPWRPSRNRK